MSAGRSNPLRFADFNRAGMAFAFASSAFLWYTIIQAAI